MPPKKPKNPPVPYRYARGFDAPEEVDYEIPRALGLRAPKLWAPGVFKIYIRDENVQTRAKRRIDELEFPGVESVEDMCELDIEEVMQLLVARAEAYAQERRAPINVHTRWVRRPLTGGTAEDAGYCNFAVGSVQAPRSAVVQEGELVEQEEHELDPHATPPLPYDPQAGYPPPGYAQGGYGYDPQMMQMQQMQMMGMAAPNGQQLPMNPFALAHMVLAMNGAFREEDRKSLQAAREHADSSAEQLMEVNTRLMKQNENQAAVNQTGWDALHKGLAMQAEAKAEIGELQIQMAAMINDMQRSGMVWDQENLKWVAPHIENPADEAAREERREWIKDFGPIGLEALGQMMEHFGAEKSGAVVKGIGQFAGALTDALDGEEGGEEDGHDGIVFEDDASAAPESAPSQPAARVAPRRPMSQRAAAEPVGHDPATAPPGTMLRLCRMLRKSIPAEQEARLKQAMQAEEWRHLTNAMTMNDEGQASAALAVFCDSIRKSGSIPTIKKELAPKQWDVLNEAAQIVVHQRDKLLAQMHKMGLKGPKPKPRARPARTHQVVQVQQVQQRPPPATAPPPDDDEPPPVVEVANPAPAKAPKTVANRDRAADRRRRRRKRNKKRKRPSAPA